MTDAVVACDKGPKTGPTELYRHFDANGALLYVGISLSAIERLRRHRVTSDWFSHIVRVDIEAFPSRKEAVAAERHAVKTEGPKYNIAAAAVVRTQTDPGKVRKSRLPADFDLIRALPIKLFAEADGCHQSTIIRRIRNGELETIPSWSPRQKPATLLVRLTDEHREVFQALADLRKAQPRATEHASCSA